MRALSYIGLFLMLGVGINAFSRGSWSATVLQLFGALAIGWFSLGLFQRAAVASMARATRGEASEADVEVLRDLGDGAAYREARRLAVAANERGGDTAAASVADRVAAQLDAFNHATPAPNQERNAYEGVLHQEHGVRIPAWWYFWPEGYDAQTMDITRIVFLPENMPAELAGKDVRELSEMGVQQIPGDKAIELLVHLGLDETGIPMSPVEQKAFARDYIARFTLRDG